MTRRIYIYTYHRSCHYPPSALRAPVARYAVGLELISAVQKSRMRRDRVLKLGDVAKYIFAEGNLETVASLFDLL